MFQKQLKLFLCGTLLLLLVLLAACSGGGSGDSGGNGGNSGNTGNTPTTQVTPTEDTSTPIVITPVTSDGTPGSGPIVIQTPTPVPGGTSSSQQAVLADRTLVIESVSMQAGSGGMSTVTIKITVKNTSAKQIDNQSTFFLLLASEGDSFGLDPNTSPDFFTAIAAHGSRSGTLTFQVPTAAATKLSMLYRPEVATETVAMTLKA